MSKVKIDKAKDLLSRMKVELLRYATMYKADGTITPNEKEHLQRMIGQIKDLENEIKTKEKQNPAKTVNCRKFTYKGKTIYMQESEYAILEKHLIKKYKNTHLAAMRNKISAANGLWNHFRAQISDQLFVAWLVSLRVGELPPISLIVSAEAEYRKVQKAIASGNLQKVIAATQQAQPIINKAINALEAYRKKTIKTAKAWVTGLNIVKSASFAVFVIAGGAVVAPVTIGSGYVGFTIGKGGAAVIMATASQFIQSTATELSEAHNGIGDNQDWKGIVADIMLATLKGAATGALNAKIMAKIGKPLSEAIANKLGGVTAAAVEGALNRLSAGVISNAIQIGIDRTVKGKKWDQIKWNDIILNIAVAVIAGGLTKAYITASGK